MKPKFRSLVTAFAPLSRSSLIVVTSLCSLASVQAQTQGTWTAAASGNWSDSTNWADGIVASAGGDANFSTVDLPGGALAVAVDSAQNVGALTFGDSDIATAGSWTVALGANLTFSGTRTITTDVNTAFTGAFATQLAADTMVKQGSALLNLSGVTTAWPGGMNLAAGTVQFRGNNSSTATVVGALTGAGTVTVSQASNGTFTQANDISGFQGGITCTVGNLRYGSSSSAPAAAVTNGSQVAFDLGSGGNLFYRNGTNGTLTFQLGALTGNAGSFVSGGGGAGAGTIIFQIGGKGTNSTFAGVVRNGATKSALVKVGPGVLTLSGTNTYTGTTTVNANSGTLQIGSNGDSGTLGSDGTTHGSVTVNTGSALEFNRAGTLNVPNVIAGAGSIKQVGSGTTVLAATNTFSTNLKINNGAVSFTADSNLGNAANGIDFTGSGKLVTSGTASTSRAISVALGSVGSFEGTAAGSALTIGGVISGDGGIGVSGSGIVNLTGVANSFAGSTTVSSGILNLSNASGSATSSGALVVNGGALSGTGSASGAVSIAASAGIKPGTQTPTSSEVGTITLGSLNLNGGSTLYTEFSSASSYDKVVVSSVDGFVADASISNPVLVDLKLVNTNASWETLGTYDLIQYEGTFSGNPDDLFEVAAGSTSPGLTYSFTASGGFIKLTIAGDTPYEWANDADGSWTTASNWSPTGVPNASEAKAILGNVITAPRLVSLSSPVTLGALSFDATNSYSITGTSVLSFESGSNNSKINVLNGAHEIATPVLLSDSVDLLLAGTSNSITLSGVVDGGGGFSAVGLGTVILGGNNTFSGNVSRSSGELIFGQGGLGNGTSVTLDNANLKWAAGNTEDISSKVITLSSGVAGLDTNGNDVLLAGAIGNDGVAQFHKKGLGRLTLNSDASHTGGTTIVDGVLQLGTGDVGGFVSGAIVNNSQLAANLVDGASLANLISGTGSFVHLGTGVLSLEAQNTFTGTTAIESADAVLGLTNSLNLQGSSLNYISTGGSIDFGGLTTVTLGGIDGDKDLSLENSLQGAVALRIGNNNEIADYSGALTGAGSLVKIGTNIQYLSGLSTYTGATTVSAGNLILEDGSIEGAALTVNGSGRMVVTGGLFGATTGTLAVSSGGLLVSEGTTTFSGAVVANGSNGSNASALIRVEGGVLSAPSINLGRTFENALAEPAGATADRNLYMTGGAVNVTNLELGTTAASNSTVVTRVDGGVLTVGGLLTVGINNTGRWSVLDINGGELVCNAPDASVVLGAPTFAGSSLFVVRGGTANVERVQFGQATYGGAGVVKLTAGDLYVGAGGLDIGTSEAGYVSTLKLSGGTLGATADWSSDAAIGIQIPFGATAVIQAGDVFDVAHDITLNGVISGEGSLVKSGSGTLTLNGANTYLGSTDVAAGTLSLTTKSLNDEAAVLVSAGSTLNLAFSGSDMVAELVLDGVTQPNGIYGKVGSGGGVIGSPFITGDGLLAVGVVAEPVSPYATWAAANGLSVGVNDGFEQDPDLDGIANSLEFALGGNPLASSTAVLPQLSLTADNFVFSFNRRDESEAEVALNFSWGSALVTWANELAIGASSAAADASGVVVTVTEGAGEGDPDAITVSVPRSNAVAGKLFGRLGATQQP